MNNVDFRCQSERSWQVEKPDNVFGYSFSTESIFTKKKINDAQSKIGS